MKFLEVQKWFVDAGFEIKAQHQVENQYWPSAYVELRKNNPWWLVDTQFGQIKIGKRKSVVSISWEDTLVRAEVTMDDVTKDNTMVHAWSEKNIQTYLKDLRILAEETAKITPVKLTIHAHSRDCNSIKVHNADGSEIELSEFTHGYVPYHMDIGGGDDLQLEIDIATGQILNWSSYTVKSRIAELLKGEDDDN